MFIRRLHEMIADQPDLVLARDSPVGFLLTSVDDVLDFGGDFSPERFLFSFPAVGSGKGYWGRRLSMNWRYRWSTS